MAIYKVALRKESVDRNNRMLDKTILQVTSLSARRAWIEMRMVLFLALVIMSLSARRAWIEIFTRRTFAYVSYSRSPQGERG